MGAEWGREYGSWASGMTPTAPMPCSVSEFLLGEVDSSTLLAVPPGDPSQVSRGVCLSVGRKAISCRVGSWSQNCPGFLNKKQTCLTLPPGPWGAIEGVRTKKGQGRSLSWNEISFITVHGEPLRTQQRGAPTQCGGM